MPEVRQAGPPEISSSLMKSARRLEKDALLRSSKDGVESYTSRKRQKMMAIML
jgi:hypothetical protein